MCRPAALPRLSGLHLPYERRPLHEDRLPRAKLAVASASGLLPRPAHQEDRHAPGRAPFPLPGAPPLPSHSPCPDVAHSSALDTQPPTTQGQDGRRSRSRSPSPSPSFQLPSPVASPNQHPPAISPAVSTGSSSPKRGRKVAASPASSAPSSDARAASPSKEGYPGPFLTFTHSLSCTRARSPAPVSPPISPGGSPGKRFLGLKAPKLLRRGGSSKKLTASPAPAEPGLALSHAAADPMESSAAAIPRAFPNPEPQLEEASEFGSATVVGPKAEQVPYGVDDLCLSPPLKHTACGTGYHRHSGLGPREVPQHLLRSVACLVDTFSAPCARTRLRCVPWHAALAQRMRERYDVEDVERVRSDPEYVQRFVHARQNMRAEVQPRPRQPQPPPSLVLGLSSPCPLPCLRASLIPGLCHAGAMLALAEAVHCATLRYVHSAHGRLLFLSFAP